MEIFIDESKEHLQQMNDILLVLEKDFTQTGLLNDIFRVAHTIKGMAGTMGFSKVQSLTHEMENLLQICRSGEMAINSVIIDILFECFDNLDSYINNISEMSSEGDIDTADLVRRLNLIAKNKSTDVLNDNNINNNTASPTSSDVKTTSEAADKFKIDLRNVSLNVLTEALQDGMYIYKIKVELEQTCSLKAARAYMVFSSLEKASEIIQSIPSTEEIEEEKFEFEFELLILSKFDEAYIQNEIKSVSEVKNVTIEVVVQEDIDKLSLSEIDELIEVKANEVKEEKVEEAREVVQNASVPQAKTKTDTKKKEDKKSSGSKMVRVDIDRLDELMNLVSELIIVKTTLDDANVNNSKQAMGSAVEYLERITTSLHDAVMKVRMVPVDHTFNRFPRMVRDLSKELDKPINLVMSGEDTEVDRTVIDEIGDPLIHMIRNSIDHGIENREIRKQRNKPVEGTVALRAYPDGNTVVIEVEDDGNGVDPERVSESAIRKGVVTKEQVEQMTEHELINLLFMPGFSTAAKVTDLSGRGVGLDVVKSKIESLQGTVEVQSEVTKGSKFVIRLPLTLAIIQALMVNIGEEKYAIPLNNIKIITNIESSKITQIQGQEVVLYRNESLPIIRLGRYLGIEEDNKKENLTVVVVRKGNKEAGLVVDNLIGQQEIVIKSLGKYLGTVKYISGATILGNGGVALIIDPNQIF